MPVSKEIHLKSIPAGMPVADNFELVETSIPDPGDGEVLVQNLYMSVDPYMRGRMRFATTGEVLMGAAIGRVVASGNPDYSEGDYVENGFGWREYFIANGRGLRKVDESLVPLSAYLGVMGMPGLTAYGGLLVTGEMKDGETVFVSAASGAVGNVVGQIAKIKGGIAIGSAGSDEKVAQLTSEFGFDHAFNYKTANPLKELRKGAPEGIDIYFENVGGTQLEAALTHMRAYGRIPICGMIAHYNDDKTPTPGPRNLTETIYKFLTLKGFVVSAFEEMRPEFQKDMSDWIKSGQLKYHETVIEGIENAPQAFMGLFTGANQGKMIVKLA
ncbi:MAG TPA: NADP-dependent oxidoreductase [Pseudomonadales bacterium]|nr:NADP-dependent oxidoreductase [Gammaproteobacteria bacterium]MDP6315570.1 NADP-dependent oxidoreductase [Pseudomonadales bacterium]MDP7316069.1 NADP-dependent oxidoreductase [Pseudomonadales bacterium]HJP50459.1 NADP-dependent oxidoreductase [Pseudomonadales bacterium]